MAGKVKKSNNNTKENIIEFKPKKAQRPAQKNDTIYIPPCSIIITD